MPGEDFNPPVLGTIETPSDAELNARYLREGVRIVTEQARYPLNQIQTMFAGTFVTEKGQTEHIYKRDPEYQRRHRWDDARKSKLIESFLMNVPVPPVFLYENDLARYEVMDGRQRLTALMDFYDDTLILADLEYWPELNGRKYSNLPASIRNGIDRRYLSSIILLNETAASDEQAAKLKKLVFERLNTGGVALSGQETRNAVYNGPLNNLCLELSQTMELRAVLGTPSQEEEIPELSEEGYAEDVPQAVEDDVVVTNIGLKMYESMEDVELVLRFFAYRHLATFPQGLNRITEFLDAFLVRANEFDESTLNSYREMFLKSIKFWFSVGGATAFQLNSRRRFSKIAFDALMYGSSALSDDQLTLLTRNDEIVRQEVENMYRTHDAVFGGRKTNAVDARQRNESALNALGAALSRSLT